jgi:UDP-N-acetylglucosamine 4-epimerase
VFSKIYRFHTIGLRYFNIFGPKQNPNNPYAAVIPLFCKHYLNNTSPVIYGDGNTSRDFTFVENAVQANIKALFKDNLNNSLVLNVACGSQISLNKTINLLQKISGNEIEVKYENERKGDVLHSKASIDKIVSELNYHPHFNFEQGLKIVFDWYKTQFKF